MIGQRNYRNLAWCIASDLLLYVSVSLLQHAYTHCHLDLLIGTSPEISSGGETIGVEQDEDTIIKNGNMDKTLLAQ
mgnify:CR=1 FL=1